MEERTDMEKVDDVMPGFRFHPTDEELVGFYLKRKIQQKSLPIELIKQVDIYKYDPWDLPRLASTGEKEWYFYCPRDRKYRNSARPNRVTRGGFWKATGTDRAIYSSQGKCIGLKKSLVFYRGRAAKGMKTDWMMHEFRLPCISDSAPSNKKFSDKSFPPSDSWAICRIFMKTNSLSMVQKALSHPWISHLPGSMVSDLLSQQSANFNNQLSLENISSTTTTEVIGSSSAIQFCSNNNNNTNNFSASEIPTYNSSNTVSKSSQINPVSNGDLADNLIFQSLDYASSMLSNTDYNIGFDQETNQQYTSSGFSISLPQDNLQTTIGFPFNLSPNEYAWRTNVPSWDSAPPCPSEISTNYATSKCYT